MRVHILQHVPFEGIGSIAEWLAERGARVTTTRFFVDPALPSAHDLDLVIAMGGPMSVNDAADYPWLAAEKVFLRAAIEGGVAVLGVCLGAQLIASALGAAVYPNTHKEIGWYPVRGCPGPADLFTFPASCKVLHWHGETFDLPQGAHLLASSEACHNQAFQLGDRVIGLQFHLESTPESLDALLENGREELVGAPFIQTEEAIRGAAPQWLPAANRLMIEVLDYLCR
ncbi:type 1 glutamine amidotransferase [Desulfuromonas carbonis]|uniref:type 1 glutamine amidotransferase n=1 Tax=Desulfuromonas sp. DDH964 TaxID=1823759 RepID=UPI00078BB9B4|nr:gamma-glutamyl-gamma-aminobutyrate hydrolase family protein [Desulfuromonas sp. DDH964]AMV72434.1 glutamine-dependent amidotransferase, class I [Desulfuromonas sp. DDH964]